MCVKLNAFRVPFRLSTTTILLSIWYVTPLFDYLSLLINCQSYRRHTLTFLLYQLPRHSALPSPPLERLRNLHQPASLAWDFPRADLGQTFTCLAILWLPASRYLPSASCQPDHTWLLSCRALQGTHSTRPLLLMARPSLIYRSDLWVPVSGRMMRKWVQPSWVSAKVGLK